MRFPARALQLLALFTPLVSSAAAHVGPGAHENLAYIAPPGPRIIAPGQFYAAEYQVEPGTELVLGVVRSRGEVDVLWMNGSQFDAYGAAVAGGGGPISYDHRRSPLFLNQRWDDSWRVEEAGRYAIVIDNTRLPAGGGRGQEEAEVFMALGSVRPLSQGGGGGAPGGSPAVTPSSPALPPPPGWLLQAAAAGTVIAFLGWRTWKRAKTPRPRGRGRS